MANWGEDKRNANRDRDPISYREAELQRRKVMQQRRQAEDRALADKRKLKQARKKELWQRERYNNIRDSYEAKEKAIKEAKNQNNTDITTENLVTDLPDYKKDDGSGLVDKNKLEEIKQQEEERRGYNPASTVTDDEKKQQEEKAKKIAKKKKKRKKRRQRLMRIIAILGPLGVLIAIIIGLIISGAVVVIIYLYTSDGNKQLIDAGLVKDAAEIKKLKGDEKYDDLDKLDTPVGGGTGAVSNSADGGADGSIGNVGGENLAEFKKGSFKWPVDNKLPPNSEQDFGPRSFGWHDGLDFNGNGSKFVYAAHEGTVIYADSATKAGPGLSALGQAVVVIKSGDVNMIYQEFGNVARGDILVKKGDKVKAGQKIGKIGPNGAGTPLHLHFGMTKKDWIAAQASWDKNDGVFIDPRPYFGF